MFEREYHRRVARVLQSLDAELLRAQRCWFGGGTAIALRCGEFRESRDIDFLVSELAGYRDLRLRMRGVRDLAPLTRAGVPPFAVDRGVRTDRYGIRAFALVDEVPVKIEIVSEGRIGFEIPSDADSICGVPTLSVVDLAASKLLANSDRWADDGVFARDVIDLAMLNLPPKQFALALQKARAAYGAAVVQDLRSALRRLREDPRWLQRCLDALSIHFPRAAMQQNLRRLARRLDVAADEQ